MTVYKYFIKIALKHKFIILSYLGIFLALSIINGVSTNTSEIQFIETRLNLGIIDRSNTEISRGMVNYLSKNNNIIKTEDDEDYIKEQIFIQMVDGVVIIPEDFRERVINKNEAIKTYKNDREIGVVYLNQQIEKYLVFANASYENGQFNLELIEEALNKEAKVEIIGDSKGINSRAKTWFTAYFNFSSYVIIAIYVAVIGLVMTEFKDGKIENRMKISSKEFLKLNREIYLGQISLGVLITTLFIFLSIFLKGKHLGQVQFGKHVFNIGVFSFAILCFTFMVNNLTRNRFVINGISTVVSLGTSFISGVMVPQEFLGEKVLSIARFFPTYYYVRINDMDISSFGDISYDIMMQIIFALVFLLMGLYFSRVKQRT